MATAIYLYAPCHYPRTKLPFFERNVRRHSILWSAFMPISRSNARTVPGTGCCPSDTSTYTQSVHQALASSSSRGSREARIPIQRLPRRSLTTSLGREAKSESVRGWDIPLPTLLQLYCPLCTPYSGQQRTTSAILPHSGTS